MYTFTIVTNYTLNKAVRITAKAFIHTHQNIEKIEQITTSQIVKETEFLKSFLVS